MEGEAEYQRVLSFLEQLGSMSASLDERELLASYSETTIAIEAHFENCFKALSLRKTALLDDAASKLQLHKKVIEGQRKEVNDSIHGCTRILEGGALLFSTNREVAIAIWKNVASIEAPKLESAVISVKLPELVMDVIAQHGTVTSDTKRIVRVKAGFVSSFPASNKDPNTQIIPAAIHFSPQDGLLVCDNASNIIKRISQQGDVTPITNPSHFKSFGGLAVNHNESIIYASDPLTHTIKKRTSSFFRPKVEVFVGNHVPGCTDGTGTQASFRIPGALTVDQLTGDVYVADVGNHKIRRITPIGVVTTVAGSGIAGFVDGIGTAATLYLDENTTITFCVKTRMLFVSSGNNLRLIGLDGKVSTLPFSINSPRGLVSLADGGLLVSSAYEHKIFHVKKQGTEKYDVTVVAGSGEVGNEDGISSLCKFHTPQGLAFDEATNTCFVADFGNERIRRFTLA